MNEWQAYSVCRGTGPVLLLVCLLLGCNGCGDDDNDTCGLNLLSNDPVLYIDGVPSYTILTREERCLVSAVNAEFLLTYGKYPSEHVDGLWVVRHKSDVVPCIGGTHKAVCSWDMFFKDLGLDYTEDGPGGVAFCKRYVFINRIGHNADYFAYYLMHEYGHAVLGLNHRSKSEQKDWCDWEDPMWFFFVKPGIDKSCPSYGGRAEYMCWW